MPKYVTGDIVRIKNIKQTYFIVTHYVDLDLKDGTKMVGYRLVKVYPVSKEVESIIVTPEDMSIVAKYVNPESEEYKNSEYKLVMDYLNEEYKRKKIDGGFDKLLKMAMSPSNISKSEIAVKQGNTKTKNNSIFITEERRITIAKPVEDTVFYHEFDDVNEGLDRMNDLQFLYEYFGDEEYLRKRELVVKRLKQLTENKE